MIFNWSSNKKPRVWASSYRGIFLFFVAPGKPTDLRVESVRDLKIMLKWRRPLTTAGAPDSSVRSYIVSYQADESGSQRQKVTTTSESAEFDLQLNKEYYIYVKAVRPNQSTLSDALKVNTNNLGEFGLIFSPWKIVFKTLQFLFSSCLRYACFSFYFLKRDRFIGVISEFKAVETLSTLHETSKETVILSVLKEEPFCFWWRKWGAIFWGMNFFSHV